MQMGKLFKFPSAGQMSKTEKRRVRDTSVIATVAE